MISNDVYTSTAMLDQAEYNKVINELKSQGMIATVETIEKTRKELQGEK
ncbi:hypothetical protein P8822_00235 [Bacillus sonorensis]|nr:MULTISPECIES: hypothetical protein [Bacillus subtilis group]MCJ8223693.1 hypothetical protein [Bacillus paralicheniformis]MEC0526242.1 hypothetical protein [Bacillus sonorensis]